MGNQVLIIEDDKEIRMMLASFLEQRGYMVWVAAEGLEATAKLKERQYDLILMDLMLPYISGEQLIAELRKTNQTPVIVLSAKTMLETRLEVLRLGADDYILKPFDLNEVLVRMEVVLRRSGGMAGGEGKAFLYLAYVGLVHVGDNAHVSKVLGYGEKRGGVEATGHGLSLFHFLAQYNAVYGAGDGGVAQVGLCLLYVFLVVGNRLLRLDVALSITLT